jgi:putative transposase
MARTARAETRVRYGYRRIHVLLRRDGWPVNIKRVCRLYRKQGLPLHNKSPKGRVKAKLRDDRSPATAANQVWAMDFVHDQLFEGRKIRILTVVDSRRKRRQRRRWRAIVVEKASRPA